MAWSSWSSDYKECIQYRERVGPLEINPQLKNQLIAYNSSLQLNCFLRGCPTPEINWTKDGVSLGNNNTLTIPQARLEDSGQYTCSVKNSEGSKNSTFWIEVAGVSPQIIAPPTDQSVTKGYLGNFKCVASGVPTPTFVWDFNNGDLPSGIHQTDQEGESLLELPRVTEEMEGTYKCTHEGEYEGEEIRDECEDKNKERDDSGGKASAQVVPRTHQTLTVGEVLTLTCKVNRETVNITWKKDGESLKERAVIDTQLNKTKSKLVITEVVEEDSGEYSCEASNKLGTVALSSVILDVIGKASAQVVPATHQTLTAGEVLTLTCKVNRETVNITWKKDGESLKERAVIDTRLNKRKSKLVITEAVEEDSGEYSCEASNKLGTVAQSSVILGVKVAPSSNSLEWYYIGGPVAVVIFLLALISYIKNRRATALQEVPTRLG
ncbi:limbic system-associated membrane protein-like [Stylophora pistillata]|uniref:limbic system-associated membrane protein-like n=1 Tax=Stylophora pistillata TaxID=50429 RepID=UPI000C05179B|nr:limbic system-associated membrane protein-like [Stylophora pistillata]